MAKFEFRPFSNISFQDLLDPYARITPPTHQSWGISLTGFVSSLGFSVVLSMLQIVVFSFLRPRMIDMYQPKCVYVEKLKRVDPISQSFFGWIKPCWKYSISEYIDLCGLDAYFLLRYLKIVGLLTFILSCVNASILIPINYHAGDNLGLVTGLDRLSWSNVSPKKVYFLNFHFVLAVTTIFLLHFVIFKELNNFIKVRHLYLLKNPNVNSVVMIDNLSEVYKQIHFGNNLLNNPLILSLNSLPGGIKNIWFVYRFSQVKTLAEKCKKILRQIEELETKIMIENWKFCKGQEALRKEVIEDTSNGLPPTAFEIESTETTRQQWNQFQIDLDNRAARPWRYSAIKWGFMKLKIPGLSTKVDRVNHLIDKYTITKKILIETRARLLREKTPCYHKMFVQFNRRVSSYIAKQTLLSSNPSENGFKVIEINSKDIIWNNVHLNNFWLKKVRYFASNILKLFLIVFWIIPTSLIGLLSQVPVNSIKFLSWIDGFPEIAQSLISGVFPAISLIVITELLPIVFRWLSVLKGKITHAEMELDIQNWCFAFLFVHVFLVVSISSSATAMLQSLLTNLGSIPTLLATNIPKASNFFLSFVLLRGVAYSGGNLLRVSSLIKRGFRMMSDNQVSPRASMKRLTKLDSIKWGSIYPIYSILGALSIIFSVIAPLILLFTAISFGLILFSYKYSLRFCYKVDPKSETFGKFYPVALKQLHYGIYFFEICLVGLFALARNEVGESVCIKQGAVMLLLFLTSVSCHLYINNTYEGALNYLPLEFLELEKEDEESHPHVINCFNDNNYDITYCHPAFDYNAEADYVWIPEDKYGNSIREIAYLKSKGINASSVNCILNDKGEIYIKEEEIE